MTARKDILGYEIVEGDDVPLTWTITDSTGAVYDFTGVTKAFFTIKKSRSDDDDDALIGPLNTADDPTQIEYNYPTADAGQIWVELTSGQTEDIAARGLCWYDYRVIKAGKVNTIVRGQISFEHETTDETS